VAWKWSDKRIVYQDPVDKEYYYGHQAQQYMFSNVFSMTSTTEEIFEKVGHPIVRRTFEGYNSCIFAFGQTNSGKTYTISGTPDSPGIISLAVKCFFDYIASQPDRRSLLRIAFLEVYNEQLKDLLSDKAAPLTIQEDADRGCPVVSNLTENVVSSLDEVLRLASAGEKRRVFGCNNVHEHASRSHTIFQIIFESRSEQSTEIRVSTLNIVDLAGSELAFTHLEGAMGFDHTVPVEHKTREREGANIRKSLLALSRVVEALARNPNDHIPYRDSKLTRILQSALGGNSSTAMIATINPWMSGIDDRQSNATLRFAVTAQKVDNHPKRVNLISPEQALLERYELELRELRDQMNKQDTSVEQREELIWKLQEEKKHLASEMATKLTTKEAALKEKELTLKEKEKRQEEMRKKYENLSKFVLTSKTLEGHDLCAAVQGIGIDEEVTLFGHKGKRRQAGAKKDEERPLRLVRRASFNCLRDAQSSSLFGLVDRAAVAGATFQSRVGLCSPEFTAADRTEFEADKNRAIVERQKKELQELEAEVAAHVAEVQRGEEQLRAERALRHDAVSDIKWQLQDWESVSRSLVPQGSDAEVNELAERVTAMLPPSGTDVPDGVLSELRETMAELRHALAAYVGDALKDSLGKTAIINGLQGDKRALEGEVAALTAKCEGLEAEGASQRSVIAAQQAEAKQLNDVIANRDGVIAKLQHELAAEREAHAAERTRRVALEAEKAAFEAYYHAKKAKRAFKGIRTMVGNKDAFKPDYRPWLRNLPQSLPPAAPGAPPNPSASSSTPGPRPPAATVPAPARAPHASPPPKPIPSSPSPPVQSTARPKPS